LSQAPLRGVLGGFCVQGLFTGGGSDFQAFWEAFFSLSFYWLVCLWWSQYHSRKRTRMQAFGFWTTTITKSCLTCSRGSTVCNLSSPTTPDLHVHFFQFCRFCFV
jgi:hypothetical protein